MANPIDPNSEEYRKNLAKRIAEEDFDADTEILDLHDKIEMIMYYKMEVFQDNPLREYLSEDAWVDFLAIQVANGDLYSYEDDQTGKTWYFRV